MYKELFKIKTTALKKIKKLPPRDQGHYLPFNSFPHGAPLGGFGSGTIGRSPYGDFNIWHLKVGAHLEEELKGCAFHIYQKDLQTGKKYTNLLTTREFNNKKLKKFAAAYDPTNCTYAAAYPKASYVFNNKKQPVEISCEQFSPILPNNYKETSYPVAVFEHTLRNTSTHEIEVSLMFSWENMTGWRFEDQRPGVQDNWFSFIKNNHNKKHTIKEITIDQKKIQAVVMGQTKKRAEEEMDGEITIATAAEKDMEIFSQEYFYTNGTGRELYDTFAEDGTLNNLPPIHLLEHQALGAALAVKTKLQPGEEKKIPFVLVWDLPIVHFGPKINKEKYYTRYFNNSGRNSWKLALQAFKNYPEWSSTIDNWHREIIENSYFGKKLSTENSKKNYFKALINELYFLADGGSFWDATTGDFGLLECFDYPFYETLDVRFYGSFPLLKFWPKIELQIMKKFSKTISESVKTKIPFNHYADNPNILLKPEIKAQKIYYDHKKIKGACPHDLGSPKKNPFTETAAYTWQNTNYWKDLNPKFILLVYRDYLYTKDRSFLISCWPAMQEALKYLLQMDQDKDGIPENEGYPDQTYDNWVMHGVSAYCGSLWLAALQAMQKTAELLEEKQAAGKYARILKKALHTFEKKLWTGRYYKFCENNSDIMTDQLIGEWYNSLTDQRDLLPAENIKKSLKTIYKYNFKKTARGKFGLVSGKKANNRPVDSEQGRDVWVGANFAFCSLLIKYGLYKEAENIINSMSHIIYDRGFFFRTPEGWDTKGHFTATMYMRPNAIWANEFIAE